ncbi:hypothetical protein [Dysosmobacter welbionis]|uniref:hypothetical protein n=1 Tax=Dysosmobacter welbionis TaxID=2093857 RepID=UPI00300F5D68
MKILLPLYREYGLEMFAKLDAEFALIIYDSKRDEFIAARDPIGIGPCTTAMTAPAPSSLPANRKTWWGCVRGSPLPAGTLLRGRVCPLCGLHHRHAVLPR